MVTTDRSDRLDPAVLRLAGILVFGALAPLLDSTIVSVAIDALRTELHTTVAVVQWVSTAYLLALAMAVPITGWAVERAGAKRMWLVALLLFLVGSVLCGAAWDIGSLIAFRVLQGIGGGLMLPILQTLLMRAAGGRQLGRLMAVVSLPALVGPILGPVVGGLIVGNLSWHWIFYVNVPICVVAIVLAWRGLAADAGRSGHRLDLVGLLLLSPAVAALLFGLAQVGTEGGFGHAVVLAPLISGAVLLALFVGRALCAERPLVDLTVFRRRSFAASGALMFLTGLSLFGPMLLLPLFYQQRHGLGVVAAGLMLVPQGVGSLLARGTGKLTDRIGPRPVVLGGIVLSVVGTLPFALGDASFWVLGGALVLRGVGLSATNMAVLVGAFAELRHREIPHASSLTRILQQVGGSLGTAVLAVVLQQTGFGAAFTWALVFAALTVVPALLLPKPGCAPATGLPG